MISGFGFNLAIARPSMASSGAAAERAVAQNGAGNLNARDTVARTNQRRVAMRTVGAKVVTSNLQLQAAKVGSKKKGVKLASGIDRLVSSLDVRTPETVAAALHEALPARGFDGHDVLTRFGQFTPANLQRVVATGTDRTKTSSCWVQPDGRYFAMNDASPAERAKAGMTPERVTYCHRLDLHELPLTLRWGGRHNPAYPANSEPVATLLEPGLMMFVYDPAKLLLAPGAEVEYWFRGDPRDALLQIIAPTHAGIAAALGTPIADSMFSNTSV